VLTTTTLVAIGVLVVGGVALLRGADIRLVLALSGLALFGVAGKWSSFVTEFTTDNMILGVDSQRINGVGR